MDAESILYSYRSDLYLSLLTDAKDQIDPDRPGRTPSINISTTEDDRVRSVNQPNMYSAAVNTDTKKKIGWANTTEE